MDHPSASKQHAVLQFRQVTERNEFGDTKSLTKCAPLLPLCLARARSDCVRPRRPFLIDLDSANGTMVNDEAVPASRFYELRSGDGALLRCPGKSVTCAPLLAVLTPLSRAACPVLKFAFSSREYVLLVEQ